MNIKKYGISFLGQEYYHPNLKEQCIWLIAAIQQVLMNPEFEDILLTEVNKRAKFGAAYISKDRNRVRQPTEIDNWYVDISHSRALIDDLKVKMAKLFKINHDDIKLIRRNRYI